MIRTLTNCIAALLIGAGSLGIGAGVAYGASTDLHVDKYAVEVGDDNGDGIIMEDESGWVCSEMGNLRCGPVA
ncbi:hypothetical protein M1247_12425 [Mycobacterium sp. 21AC1]|uniref:hypothetical protein n=1 Tax=[Mycobacterium] appelbergii TaxID=2939269 RepID=UPI0029394162|nr:hypothetical protein [Mycobacterium sp. 21AC1]MDV3125724.1 hypothetical protein [Mycobacterium sp. 21AC1]